MLEDDKLYLGHMLETARKALRLVAGRTRADYDSSEELRLALTHLPQIVGEAARHVSREFRDAYPEIPWHAIVGMRHKVVHDYMGVDEDVVWRTTTEELGDLIEQLEQLLPPDSRSP